MFRHRHRLYVLLRRRPPLIPSEPHWVEWVSWQKYDDSWFAAREPAFRLYLFLFQWNLCIKISYFNVIRKREKELVTQ